MTRQSIPNAPALAQQVLFSLKEDKADLARLKENLENEKSVLENRQHDKLALYAQQKSELTARLEQRHQNRITLLQGYKIEVDSNSWRGLIEQLEAQARLPLSGLWNEVEQQLEDCRKLLLVNEKIVGHLKNNVSQLLSNLRGTTSTGQTYSKSGKAQLFSDNQSITSA